MTRALLIAEAANPEWVSVPLVGWQLARALREVADVHVVTQVRNRDAITRAGWREGVDFTCIDSEAFARPLYLLGEKLRGGANRGWTTAMAAGLPAYYWFEHLLWRRFGDDVAGRRFDVVHRITPLSPSRPSLVARRCARAGVPFVLGPLNGGVPWPRQFASAQHAEREWLSALRGAYRVLPAARSTRNRASAILVGSRATWDDLPRRVHPRTFYLPENAIDPERFPRRRAHAAGRPLRLVFVGRLVPLKGVDMLLEAAAPLLARGDATLEVVGDGPERARLEAQAGALPVTFSGWLDHGRVGERLAAADVFVFPSIREFGGGAVLEAMATGCVPVVVRYAGPGELVTPDVGVAVPLGTRAEIVAHLGRALEQLCADPARVDALGRACVTRVAERFTWARKAETVTRIWDWVLGRGPKPDLPPPPPG